MVSSHKVLSERSMDVFQGHDEWFQMSIHPVEKISDITNNLRVRFVNLNYQALEKISTDDTPEVDVRHLCYPFPFPSSWKILNRDRLISDHWMIRIPETIQANDSGDCESERTDET